jgi:hypothetical protein
MFWETVFSYNPVVLIITIYIAYFFYTRVFKMYQLKRFYENQGIPCCKDVIPILGNMPRIEKIFKTYNRNENPWYIMMNEDFPKQPSIVQWFTGFEPTLMICDPELLNELYVTKNKYFDKHQRMADIFRPLLGDSTLM